MLRPFRLLSAIMLPLCAGACSNNAGSVSKGLNARFVDSAETRNALTENGDASNRSGAMGVVSNLGGSMETTRTQLGPAVIVLGRLPVPEHNAMSKHSATGC